MDVALSIVAGFGLRLFLTSATDAGPSSPLTTALLGLWEGVVVHQVSARSNSPRLDHLLAYGLRLAIDLLISKEIPRMITVFVFSGLAAFISESVVPHTSLRFAIKKEQERGKERRHRPSRSESLAAPIISTTLPPRIRAYRPPEQENMLATSTPAQLSTQKLHAPISHFPPLTPPSFFLQEHEDSCIYSPEQKPVQVSTVEKAEPSPLPVRPRSGIASILETSPEPGLVVSIPGALLTPPESAQSAIPSDGPVDNETKNDSQNLGFERELYTIPELSSPEDDSPPRPSAQPTRPSQDVPETAIHLDSLPAYMSSSNVNAPLPVPNADMRQSNGLSRWLASQSTHASIDTFLTNHFSPNISPPGPDPLPVQVRIHNQDSSPKKPTLYKSNGQSGDDNEEHMDADGSVVPEDNESDPLRTPAAPNALRLEDENEFDSDPLQTPQQQTGMLSPLGLDVRSGLDSQPESGDSTPGREVPRSAATQDQFPIPGSLSQNVLLQAPLPSSGPLFGRTIPPPLESPPPPSPSTINSGASDISILSTRIPSKLYSKADELRQKAREEEKTRAQIESERQRAEAEGRTLDALSLKIKVRDLDLGAQKLHEKAARRYYAGSFFFLPDTTPYLNLFSSQRC